MEAEKDKDIVLVHAGMEMDLSLQLFQEKFPERYFDVGMAEQHAVTFSAGLACGGLKPFCIIPSAFLQRAYDQVHSHSSVQKSLWSFGYQGHIRVRFLDGNGYTSFTYKLHGLKTCFDLQWKMYI